MLCKAADKGMCGYTIYSPLGVMCGGVFTSRLHLPGNLNENCLSN